MECFFFSLIYMHCCGRHSLMPSKHTCTYVHVVQIPSRSPLNTAASTKSRSINMADFLSPLPQRGSTSETKRYGWIDGNKQVFALRWKCEGWEWERKREPLGWDRKRDHKANRLVCFFSLKKDVRDSHVCEGKRNRAAYMCRKLCFCYYIIYLIEINKEVKRLRERLKDREPDSRKQPLDRWLILHFSLSLSPLLIYCRMLNLVHAQTGAWLKGTSASD